ncbi:MAG: AAA family ATPase [Segetibacter sp.]
MLIDEIEQGLEPDRVQHLANTLKRKNKGQIFITTHSRDVLVELQATDLFLMKKGATLLTDIDPSLQGLIRKNPEAFFAHKVIVCEGVTEIGICRALNKYRIEKLGRENAAFLGVRYADGTGRELTNYTKGFNKATFPVCLFCDSDDLEINKEKQEMLSAGIKIIDWKDGDCLEVALVKYLPLRLINPLMKLATDLKSAENPGLVERDIIQGILDAVKARLGRQLPEMKAENDSVELRTAIGKAASKGAWFKSQTKGEVLGDFLFNHFEEIEDNILKQGLIELSKWIDGNGL